VPATLARPSRTPTRPVDPTARSTGPARRGLAATLSVGAALLLVASGALLGSRYVPARALPLAPDTWAMVTAFTDLAAPGLLLATAAAGVATALRARRARVVLVAVCVAATGVQALLLAPRWVAAAPPAAERSFTVLALNSRLGRADPGALTEAARDADVVVLTEATAPQVRALVAAGLTGRFPYRSTGRLPAAGAAGTAVFSRFPVSGTAALAPDLGNQAWSCRVAVPGVAGGLIVLAVHPARPRLGGTHWLPEQEELRAALPTTGPRLLAGDFNAVASHPTQRALVRDGWRSAVDDAGAGWVPTYPADSRRVPPMIDIDHVFVAGGLQTAAVRSVRVPGTDHLGLLATVAVPAAD
jgi:endonuclease/exonuclease/phosphatase (EEP) superfamily protein YafD